jgi:hypothetical protein
MKSGSSARKLLESGIIFAMMGFFTNAIFYVFQIVISRNFSNAPGEFGLATNMVTLIGLLGLPLTIATYTVTHYIARFHFSGDDARLHGLLAGCRTFLRNITIGGSIAAIILIEPISRFFHIPRSALTIIALVCVLANLWSSYFSALCQGLGWFKRLGLILFLAAVVRLLFGWPTTRIWPIAEWAVLASVAMMLPNLILFFWRHEFPRPGDTSVSPWNSEFVQFLIVSTAWAIGSYFFTQGDNLVSQRHFGEADRDAYASVERLAAALVTVTGPLLVVLFTHRSRRQHHTGSALGDQLKLLGLYTGVLVFGAVSLYFLRGFCLELFNRNTPEARGMIGRLAITMVFVGLLQAIATWSLASCWTKTLLLYGALGVGYWTLILVAGKTPALLLDIMPFAAGFAFLVMFIAWIATMRQQPPAEPVPAPETPPQP